MEYKIFEGNLPRLEKKLRAISKKCEKYGTSFHYEQIGEVFEKVTLLNGKEEIWRYVMVSVDGTAEVPGWKLIASVSHEQAGNVLKKCCTDIEIPKRYWIDKPYCEHCGCKRERKYAYLIQNVKTGEMKQVGKNCLYEYTHGMSAEMAAAYVSLYDSLMEFETPPENYSNPYYFCTQDLLLYAAETIRIYGYESKVTKEKVMDFYLVDQGRLPSKIAEEIRVKMEKVRFVADREDNHETVKNAMKWISDEIPQDDYMHNLKLVSGMEYIKENYLGILVSLLPAYARHQKQENAKKEKAMEDATSQWVGTVGERINIDVKSYAVITSWESMYGLTAIYKIIDTDGNVYIWKTTSDLPERKKICLSATVKEHTIYRDVHQTQVTRCRVTSEKEILKENYLKWELRPVKVNAMVLNDPQKETSESVGKDMDTVSCLSAYLRVERIPVEKTGDVMTDDLFELLDIQDQKDIFVSIVETVHGYEVWLCSKNCKTGDLQKETVIQSNFDEITVAKSWIYHHLYQMVINGECIPEYYLEIDKAEQEAEKRKTLAFQNKRTDEVSVWKVIEEKEDESTKENSTV